MKLNLPSSHFPLAGAAGRLQHVLASSRLLQEQTAPCFSYQVNIGYVPPTLAHKGEMLTKEGKIIYSPNNSDPHLLDHPYD